MFTLFETIHLLLHFFKFVLLCLCVLGEGAKLSRVKDRK